MTDHNDPQDHTGLHYHLARVATQRQPARRQALRLLGGLGLASSLPLLGCGGSGGAQAGAALNSGTTTGTTTGTTGSTTTVGSCAVVPAETAGPFPGDGTNTSGGATSNVLTLASVVRSDIRSSIDGASGTASGVPLTVTLTLVNTNAACAALANHAVYLWHCDSAGRYSLYSGGVQVSDANGQLSFTTVFPGCYSGRWPHIHFEIFPSLASATSGNSDIKTSQLALPQAACTAVYGSGSGYSASAANLSNISLASDGVFRNDSAVLQMATVTGSVASGFAAQLVVGIAA